MTIPDPPSRWGPAAWQVAVRWSGQRRIAQLGAGRGAPRKMSTSVFNDTGQACQGNSPEPSGQVYLVGERLAGPGCVGHCLQLFIAPGHCVWVHPGSVVGTRRGRQGMSGPSGARRG